MSQHTYQTEVEGQQVSITLGWDRPLGHFFMQIVGIPQDTSKDAEAEVLYTNLYEPNAFELTLDDYREVLSHMGIEVPASMFEQVELDQKANVGNRIATHNADGTYYDQPDAPRS